MSEVRVRPSSSNDPRRPILEGVRTTAQGPSGGHGSLSACPALVEAATGSGYNFPHYGPLALPLDRFGTSTWTYEGWQGQVYKRQYAKSTFARECLGEYCQYQYQGAPLFRTVGNDSTFYRPPTSNQLRHYLKQIPEDFQMCFKVWEDNHDSDLCEAPSIWSEGRSAESTVSRRGLFNDLVLTPYREAKFESHTGPFLFEFQRHGMSTDEFCSRLDQFLLRLPRDFQSAVEVRNLGLFDFSYLQVLSLHGVAHV